MITLPLISVSGPIYDPTVKPDGETKGTFGIIHQKKPLFIPAASSNSQGSKNNNQAIKSHINLVG
jgi:hypothetical protein